MQVSLWGDVLLTKNPDKVRSIWNSRCVKEANKNGSWNKNAAIYVQNTKEKSRTKPRKQARHCDIGMPKF